MAEGNIEELGDVLHCILGDVAVFFLDHPEHGKDKRLRSLIKLPELVNSLEVAFR
jgi:hypothetical protein